MIKKIINFLFLLLLLISLNGCSLRHIEDTNGEDDFTVTQITDEKIIKDSQYLSYRSIRNSNGNETNIKIEKMSGVMRLQTIKVQNESLVYNIDSTVNSGNFRIVIVHDKKIIHDIEINTQTIIEIPNAIGEYILKIVGESANFKMVYSITKN